MTADEAQCQPHLMHAPPLQKSQGQALRVGFRIHKLTLQFKDQLLAALYLTAQTSLDSLQLNLESLCMRIKGVADIQLQAMFIFCTYAIHQDIVQEPNCDVCKWLLPVSGCTYICVSILLTVFFCITCLAVHSKLRYAHGDSVGIQRANIPWSCQGQD